MLKNLESHHIESEENEQVVWCCGQQANAILSFINENTERCLYLVLVQLLLKSDIQIP